MRWGAATTVPPKTAPMHWWPRQTPRIGISPARARMRPCDAPSSGRPGPGEMRRASGRCARIPVHVDGVVAEDDGRRPQLAQLLDQVVDERVVVVESRIRTGMVGWYRITGASAGNAPPGLTNLVHRGNQHQDRTGSAPTQGQVGRGPDHGEEARPSRPAAPPPEESGRYTRSDPQERPPEPPLVRRARPGPADRRRGSSIVLNYLAHIPGWGTVQPGASWPGW